MISCFGEHVKPHPEFKSKKAELKTTAFMFQYAYMYRHGTNVCNKNAKSASEFMASKTGVPFGFAGASGASYYSAVVA